MIGVLFVLTNQTEPIYGKDEQLILEIWGNKRRRGSKRKLFKIAATLSMNDYLTGSVIFVTLSAA